MKRFHVHVAVKDLESSIRFYSALFGMQPSVVKSDYAKWMVEDPRINFAISQRGSGNETGVNHLGLQVDSDDELEALKAQAEHADLAATGESGVCCYARSNKYWYTDPTGVAWETYHTLGQVEYFGGERGQASQAEPSCCTPGATVVPANAGQRAKSACCG